MLTPTEKGNITEAKLAAAAIELGIGVCLPIGDGCRYDLIFDLHPELVRVQAKWAPRKGDILVVGLRTNRCTPRRSANSRVRATHISDSRALETTRSRALEWLPSTSSGL